MVEGAKKTPIRQKNPEAKNPDKIYTYKIVKKAPCTGKGAKKTGKAKKPGGKNPRFRLYNTILGTEPMVCRISNLGT